MTADDYKNLGFNDKQAKKMFNNSEYWIQRAKQLEESQNKKGLDTYFEIEKQYRQAQKEIENKINTWYQRLAANNKISMSEARKMLSNNELKEFKWDVKDYIKYGKENAINERWIKELENASAKFHISKLEALKLQTQQSLEVMFGNQLDKIDNTMRKIYTDGYFRNAYELQKGIGVGWNIAGIDQSQLDKVIMKPWVIDRKNFSERIWDNKEKLISEVHKELTQNIILGADPQRAIDNIAKKMNTSKANAGRLVMTEKAYFSALSQKDCYKELGVEEYKIVATLDSVTSEICQTLDSQHFPMKDFQPGTTAPPFHVNCRSTTAPYFKDNFGHIGERSARGKDGKTYYVPENMDYKEWKKTFVDGGDKSKLQKTAPDAIIKIREIISDKKSKLDLLKAEYESLNKINDKYLMTSNDFASFEEEQEWKLWKNQFKEIDSIERVQQRILEIEMEISETNGELAKARIQLLKSGSIEFKPAKTIKEANEYAIKSLGINAEYKGLDIRAANEWNQGLTNMKEVFPDLVEKKFRFVGESHERNAIIKEIEYNRLLKYIKENNTCNWDDKKCEEWAKKKASSFIRKYLAVSSSEMASSWYPPPIYEAGQGICMNKSYFGDYDRALEKGIRQVKNRFHPESCSTVKATFDHEFGHQLDKWFGVGKQANIRKLFNSKTPLELTQELSEYSWNNSNPNKYAEMIAEAWSEYCNNPNPRPIAVEVGKTIERLYVEWAKKNF